MAQGRIQWDSVSCPVCLDFLKDPVTTPCGHSFCMSCINTHWDQQSLYSCPQCRQRFRPRPVLVKNTVLADLVKQLKTTGLTAPPADHCSVGPGDVACDSCTETKLKAVKSCLQCLASFCENHVQPHYRSPVFKTHQLVAPSLHLQDYICSVHNKALELFCRSDQQCICSLCSVDQHRGHRTVSATDERVQRERELGARRDQLLQTIQDRERDLQKLPQEAEALRSSAQEAVERSRGSFIRLVRLLEKSQSEVEQQIWSELKSGEAQVRELQDKLQQDITELRTTLAQMDSLFVTEDHSHFLQTYLSLPTATKAPDQVHTSPQPCFKEVMTAVSELTDQLQLILTNGLENISLTLSRVKDLLPQPEPSSRKEFFKYLPQPEPSSRNEFLRYFQEITLDPNTVNTELSLSEGNKRVTHSGKRQRYHDDPDRFSYWSQVLSRESLTGRCYWEVDWSGMWVYVAVAYKTIHRKGETKESQFGCNKKSLALRCDKTRYKFWYNRVCSPVSGPVSGQVSGPGGSKIGVYLDHDAGVLSFYSIKDQTMTLLHRVQTTFTQPLLTGFWVGLKTTAAFCKIK